MAIIRPILVALLVPVGLLLAEEVSSATLLPAPQSRQLGASPVGIAPGAGIEISTSRESERMSFLQAYLGDALTSVSGGFSGADPNASIQILLHRFGDAPPANGLPAGLKPFPQMGSEGYVLVAEPSGAGLHIVAAADDPHGLWNAGTTLLQLLLVTPDGPAESEVHPQSIRDFPDHSVRAADLPSASLPKVGSTWQFSQSVQDLIDELARLKFNRIETPQTNSVFKSENWDNYVAAFAQAQVFADNRFVDFVGVSGDIRNGATPRYMDGWWTKREPFAFEAIPIQRLGNPSFEVDLDSDGIPDQWSIEAIDPNRGTWSVDQVEAYEGTTSMRIDVAFSSENNPTQIPSDPNDPNSPLVRNPLSTMNLRLVQNPAIPALGHYLPRACFKTLNLQGIHLQVRLATRTTSGESRAASAVSLLGTHDWQCRISTEDPVLIDPNTNFISVWSRLNEGGHGTAWIDQVELVPVTETSPGVWEPLPEDPVRIAVPVAAAPNLLTNPSFEDGLEPDGETPVGWNLERVDPNHGRWELDTSVSRTGNASMRLTIPDDEITNSSNPNNSLRLRLVQWVNSDIPGGIYHATGWMKTEDVSPADFGQGAQITVGDSDPNKVFIGTATGPLGSSDWTQLSLFVRVPDGHDKLNLYSRLNEDGHGTLWLDDVSIRRIGGDLRNVARGGYDLRVEPVGGGTPYVEGVDYEVIDGELQGTWEPDLIPSQVRLLSGTSIDPNGQVWISYDSVLYWDQQQAFNQAPNLCSQTVFDEYFDPQLQHLLVDLEAASGLTHPPLLAIQTSEVRGFNRSGACHTVDGALIRPNGQVLAEYVNAFAAAGQSRQPGLQYWAWHDMFTLRRNGARGYEFRFGGSHGATICAVDPTHSECGPTDFFPTPPISTDVAFAYWHYGDDAAYEMEASRFLHEDLGHPFLAAPGDSPRNIRDWAAVTVGEPMALGFMREPYFSEGGLDLAADMFWNSPWEEIFFAPLSEGATPGELPSGYTLSGTALFKNDGSCAKGVATFPGGACMGPGLGTLTLPDVQIEAGRTYGIWVTARSGGAATIELDADFGVGGSEQRTLVLNDTSGSFERFPAGFDPLPITAPSGAEPLTLSLSTSDALAIDNVMIWEQRLLDPVCADPNSDSDGNGLSDACETSTCGDGIVDLETEQCDDGNLEDGDGCDSSCSTENCFACTGEPSSCSCDVGQACGMVCGTDLNCLEILNQCLCRLPCSEAQGGDADADGICQNADLCPVTSIEWNEDRDEDGVGDPCDCTFDTDDSDCTAEIFTVAICFNGGSPILDPNCTLSDMNGNDVVLGDQEDVDLVTACCFP